MTPQNEQISKDLGTLTGISELDLSQCEVTVCLASFGKDDELPKFKRLQLTDDLTEDFRGVVKESLQKVKKNLPQGDLVLKAYEAGSKPDPHEVEHINLSEHESVKKQLSSLPSPADMDIFSGDDNFLTALRFYVIIIQPRDGQPIYCFRLYSQKKELHRSPFFAALFSGGHFDRVRDPMFLFDQHIDCLSRGEDMFIFNKDKFQKIFRFLELVVKRAKSTLRIIKACVPIANFNEFEKACEGHLQKLAKLNNIASKPYLKKVKMVDIKRVIKEFNLPIQTLRKDGKEMLVFDSSDKWALLRLLDDDYLESLMTGQNYEVTGKRQL